MMVISSIIFRGAGIYEASSMIKPASNRKQQWRRRIEIQLSFHKKLIETQLLKTYRRN